MVPAKNGPKARDTAPQRATRRRSGHSDYNQLRLIQVGHGFGGRL